MHILGIAGLYLEEDNLVAYFFEKIRNFKGETEIREFTGGHDIFKHLKAATKNLKSVVLGQLRIEEETLLEDFMTVLPKLNASSSGGKLEISIKGKHVGEFLLLLLQKFTVINFLNIQNLKSVLPELITMVSGLKSQDSLITEKLTYSLYSESSLQVVSHLILLLGRLVSVRELTLKLMKDVKLSHKLLKEALPMINTLSIERYSGYRDETTCDNEFTLRSTFSGSILKVLKDLLAFEPYNKTLKLLKITIDDKSCPPYEPVHYLIDMCLAFQPTDLELNFESCGIVLAKDYLFDHLLQLKSPCKILIKGIKQCVANDQAILDILKLHPHFFVNVQIEYDFVNAAPVFAEIEANRFLSIKGLRGLAITMPQYLWIAKERPWLLTHKFTFKLNGLSADQKAEMKLL